jgi:peptide deformylase
MDLPAREAKSATRTVTCGEICTDAIERMKRPDPLMKPVDALANMHFYASMITLGKVPEANKDEYDLWLKRFEQYAAVVPHVRVDLDKACVALSNQIAENFEQLDKQSTARRDELKSALLDKVGALSTDLKRDLDSRERSIRGQWQGLQVMGSGLMLLLVFIAAVCLGSTLWLHSTMETRISLAVSQSVQQALNDVLLQIPPPPECAPTIVEPPHEIVSAPSNSTTFAAPTTPSSMEAEAYAPMFQLLLGTATPYTRACSPLTPKSSAEDVGFNVEDLRNSVRYYLATSGAGKGDRRLSYLSAIHVDVPYCYCVVNTDYSRNIKYLNDDALVEMFNPRIVGYAHSRLVRSRERHHECERPAAYIRSETVWVRYEDATGKQLERRFDGPLAYELQHIAELHSGEFRCHEELKEAIERAVEQSIVRNISPYMPNQLRWELPSPTEEREKRLLS